MQSLSIRRALLSVSDKTGIITLARGLHSLGIQLIATGGTAKILQADGIPILDVASITGFPEIMDGRVKTLHPHIHAGILARTGIDEAVLETHHISPIDLVIVNLYPFAETVANPASSLAAALDHIDIGGVTLIRAAAKNHTRVTVVVRPEDYTEILRQIQTMGHVDETTRLSLAQKAFAHTAEYDATIAHYFTEKAEDKPSFPSIWVEAWQQCQTLRYGENPHQQAAVYAHGRKRGIVNAVPRQGKPLSYNNLMDADTAYTCVQSLGESPACVIVKHANPCGVAIAPTQPDAYVRAYTADSISAFGGIIAFNQTISAETARAILANPLVEVIIAPDVHIDAQTLFSEKPNIRVLTCPWDPSELKNTYDIRSISGGVLIQTIDHPKDEETTWQCVTQRHPQNNDWDDMRLAWKVAQFVKSNAIVMLKHAVTLGIGAGQPSRVDSVRLSIEKARAFGFDLTNATMASDAFFPFPDGIITAIQAGITTIIQPGGSIRDPEIIKTADQANIAMVFTNVRHFRH